jgi:hypothetical protein
VTLSCTTWGNLSIIEAILILNDREFPLFCHPSQYDEDVFACTERRAKVQLSDVENIKRAAAMIHSLADALYVTRKGPPEVRSGVGSKEKAII